MKLLQITRNYSGSADVQRPGLFLERSTCRFHHSKIQSANQVPCPLKNSAGQKKNLLS
jgi:hypothetical protein